MTAWTPEMDRVIITLRRELFTARQTAYALNAMGFPVTRNAVIGRIFRLRMMDPTIPVIGAAGHRQIKSREELLAARQERDRRWGQERQRRKVAKMPEPPPEKAPVAKLPDIAPKPKEPATFRPLSLMDPWPSGRCRFPVYPHGKPPRTGAIFCGDKTAKGDYCATHYALMYRPPDPKYARTG